MENWQQLLVEQHQLLEERELELQQAIEFGQSLIQCKQELEDENESLKQEITLLKQNVNDQHQLLLQTKNERNNLHIENETLKQQLEEMHETLTSTQKTNTNLTRMKQDILEQNNTLVEKLEKAEEEASSWKEECFKWKSLASSIATTTATNTTSSTTISHTNHSHDEEEEQIKMKVQVIKLQMQRDLEEQHNHLTQKFESWKQTHLSKFQHQIQSFKSDFISLYKTVQSMNTIIQQSSKQIMDSLNHEIDFATRYPDLYASIQLKIITSLGLEDHYGSFGSKPVKPEKKGNGLYKLFSMSDYKPCVLQVSKMSISIYESNTNGSQGKLLHLFSLQDALCRELTKSKSIFKKKTTELELVLQPNQTILSIQFKDTKETVEWKEFLHIVMSG